MIDKERIENAVNEILLAIGEDPKREGLLDTPKRVADMYEEVFCGIGKDALEHVKIFKEPVAEDQVVLVDKIPMYSMCEHHMLPFFGHVSIAYLPKNGNIIGLSKLSRIVECFSRRLQVQERLTAEIANFVYENVGARGVAVKIEAEHLCMTMRGVRAMGAKTKTIFYKGEMQKDESLKQTVTRLLDEE